MTSTIDDLRSSLADRIRAETGVPSLDRVPQQVEELLVVVRFGGVPEYRSTMGRGIWEVDLDVDVVVPMGGETADAETVLSELVSPVGIRSVPVAIEADQTLDGYASAVIADTCSEFQSTSVAGTRCLIATITARVISK